MSTKSTINVIYQFNEKYVPYAGVSITSLLVNNKESSVNIIILGEGLSDTSKDMLEKTASGYGANIVFPDTSPLIARFKDLGMLPYRGAYSVYLRLFFSEIPELSDLCGQRAIYLDADTIVDKSLLPLVEYDLGEKSVGMVLESIRDDYKVMIGMSPDSDYYNSGVILFDVDGWRSNGYCDRIVDHIRNVRSTYIGDQDFLNIVCEGDVCKLPPAYNFQPLHARYSPRQYFGVYGSDGYYTPALVEDARSGATVYHCYRWLGEFPWNSKNLHPFNDLFDKYKAMSLWKDQNKEAAGTGFVLKVEKLLYMILPRYVFIRIFKLTHELMLKKAEADARASRVNERS